MYHHHIMIHTMIDKQLDPYSSCFSCIVFVAVCVVHYLLQENPKEKAKELCCIVFWVETKILKKKRTEVVHVQTCCTWMKKLTQSIKHDQKNQSLYKHLWCRESFKYNSEKASKEESPQNACMFEYRKHQRFFSNFIISEGYKNIYTKKWRVYKLLCLFGHQYLYLYFGTITKLQVMRSKLNCIIYKFWVSSKTFREAISSAKWILIQNVNVNVFDGVSISTR